MHQIRLDNAAFEGENNAYLLDGEGGPITLIDTGISAPDVEEELRARLADRDLAFADIERILLTHHHQDHAGLAAAIQQESDAAVVVHPDDMAFLGNTDETLDEVQATLGHPVEQWGVPAAKRDELEEILRHARQYAGPRAEPTALDLEATYSAGGTELTPIHLPGHSLGHVGYRLANGELAAGDALLPVYTPNIGGADPRVSRPLPTYLETLAKIVRMDPPVVWPGHRDRIDDPRARAREIRAHHRERTQRVIEALDEEGPMTAWELALHLFGDLSSIHVLHGPGEAYAHLDHLAESGIVEERDRRYHLLERRVDYDALVPALD